MHQLRRAPLVASTLLLCGLSLLGAHAAHAAPPLVNAEALWIADGGALPVHATVSSRSHIPFDVTVTATCGATTAVDAFTVLPRGTTARTLMVPTTGHAASDCMPQLAWQTSEGDSARVHVATTYTTPTRVRVRNPATGPAAQPGETVLTPAQAPDRWAAYPRGAAVILEGDATEATLSDAQRDALRWFSQAGGTLVLVAIGDETEARWREQGAHFETEDTWAAIDGADPHVASPYPDDPDGVTRFHAVPGTEEIPVGGFMGLVFAFALLVGPLNLWWVIYRKRRRSLFLVTTPLIALGACAVMLLYNVVAEGLDVRRTAIQLTWLDAANHRGVTWTGATYFAGLGADDTTLPAETAVVLHDRGPSGDWEYYSPHASSAYGMGGGGFTALQADYRGGEQRLSGGLVPSRVNRQFVFTTPHAERRRLRVAKAGEGYSLTNHLDVPITELRWVDEAGRSWLSGPLGPGETAPMRALHTREAPLDGTSVDAQSLELPDHDLQRLDRGARAVARRGGPFSFFAHLGAPLRPLPGPDAVDAEPVLAYATGHISPARAEATP